MDRATAHTPTLPLPRPATALRWRVSRRGQTWLALGLYLAVGVACFGWAVLPHLDRSCACVAARADPSTYIWNLEWWAQALRHGHDPFVSRAVYAPSPTPLGDDGALLPGPGIVLLPITMLFGPLVAYNVLMLASPVLAALFAFCLCRYLTERFAASLVGGYLFGFSAYMLGHLVSHANLVLVFPIPAAVHLTLRLLDGRIGRGRYIVLAGLSLAFLVLCSTELAFTFVGFATLTVLLALVLAPAARTAILRAIPVIIGAGLLAGALSAPFLRAALADNTTTGFTGNGDLFGGDLLSYLLPTRTFWLGHGMWSGLTASFSDADVAESGLYVGAPLAFIALAELLACRRAPATRVMAVMLVSIGVLTLGSHLHIAGRLSTIPLPWLWLSRSGFLNELVPARFGIYTFLIVAILAAQWLAAAPTGRPGVASWIAIALALLFLLPDVGAGLWHSRPENPALFTTGAYRAELSRDENVLMLPAPNDTDSMLWQAETGMWFRQASGYFGRFTPPPDYAGTALGRDTALGVIEHPLRDTLALRAFVRARGVGAIIVDPRRAGRWPAALEALRLPAHRIGGVILYRIPAAWRRADGAQPQNAISSRARPTGSS